MEQRQLKSFKDLKVWQKAADLASLVYIITEKFPRSELYGLTNQMRRSVISISSNIAERFKRNHKKEKLQFYNIAYGSTTELESQIEIVLKLNFINKEDYQKLPALIVEVSKMLDALIKSSNKSPKSYILNSIFLFIALSSIFYILTPFPVFAAQMSFDAKSTQVHIGEKFEVKLFLNSERESINAFEGNMSFPGGILDLKEIRDGNTIVNFWVEKPKNQNDAITFSGVTPGGFNGERGLIFSAIFEARKEGVAGFEVGNARVLRNDGIGSTATLTVKNLEFRIQDLGKPESLYSKSYILYPDDKEPPESFAPEIAKDATLFEGKWFVVFTTQDKASGIDHYEIKESRQRILSVFKKWTSVESPYVLADQRLRNYVWIRAVDKAGNERVEKINPRNPLAWYENYENWIMIIIGVLVALLTAKKLWRKKHT